TKIVCTLGPACHEPDVLEKMLRAGMTVGRVNFSHGSHEEHGARIANFRTACGRSGIPAGILLDLCGPKIRTGTWPGGAPVTVKAGDSVTFVSAGVEAKPGEIPTSIPGLHRDVRAGEPVLVEDGKIRLRAVRVLEGRVVAEVEEGGAIAEKKGINLPGTALSVPAISEKDRKDIGFGVEQGVDFIALSFVRKPQDVLDCREEIRRRGGDIPIVAKIETPAAVENLDAILEATDGVMVARGDLAVEVSTARVPLLQKEIIRKSNQRNRVVITATQMLESMIDKSTPTRAEATDVANAVLDGTDALMTSGETSVGRHPVTTVATMATIAREVERSPFFLEREQWSYSEDDDTRGLSIAHAAVVACREYKADAIVAFSESGKTAILLSKFKPKVPIFACTPRPATVRRMGLTWGTEPVQVSFGRSTDEMIAAGERALLERGLLKPGAKVIVTAGTVTAAGGTDMMKVLRVGQGPAA
ncbi:MAG: pyruvate kinase, partial [Planctomycetes bacterium]|nr:pyruvate kinase [Planctomycetota bacterium]